MSNPGTAAPQPTLARNAIGLPASTFQGITHMAPAAGVILGIAFIAGSAGAALPLAFFLALIICLLISFSINQLARHLPSAGGYYTYVSRSISPKIGFLTGWLYFLYDPLIPNLCTLTVAVYFSSAVQQLFGLNIPWWAYAGVVFLGLGALTYIGISLSIRTAIVFTVVEIVITMAMSLAIFIKYGVTGHDAIQSFTLAGVPKGVSGIAFGLIFGVLSYTGFESTVPLAEETKNPRFNIAWAAVLSVLVVGVYYVIFAFATTVGWGPAAAIKTLSTANTPFVTLAHNVAGGVGVAFLTLALMNSGWGCSLAGQNAVIRVFYKMGKVGVLPKALGRIHPRFKTPHVAVIFQTVLNFVVMIILGVTLGPLNGFGLLATVITVGLLFVYAAGMISVPIFYRREHPNETNLFLTYVFPIVGTLLLIPILYASVYPAPAFPLNLAPYVDLVWFLLGIAVLVYLSRTRPAELEAGAQEIFVETVGEVE
ncbi:MAG TPA: APC family permease [Candidatus Dormibacteraeota bacterium]|jgi:amino acid transporter|nr:APC family permease [Candidatus Dormibacteraeota bacterium]